MNNTTRFFIFLVATVLPILAHAQTPKEVSVCWEDGLKPPYLMLDQEQRPTGIAVELINEIFQRGHIHVINVLCPWKRCLEDVKTNKVTVVPNSSYKTDRAEYALYSHLLYETHLVLFYNKTKFPQPPLVKTMDDLAKHSVLGVLGFNYDRYQNKIKIYDSAPDRESLIKMLQYGRGDLAAEQKEVILFMHNQGKVDLRNIGYITDPAQAVQTFYVLVSKLHPQAKKIIAVLNTGIDKLKQDGTYQRIHNKYIGPQQ